MQLPCRQRVVHFVHEIRIRPRRRHVSPCCHPPSPSKSVLALRGGAASAAAHLDARTVVGLHRCMRLIAWEIRFKSTQPSLQRFASPPANHRTDRRVHPRQLRLCTSRPRAAAARTVPSRLPRHPPCRLLLFRIFDFFSSCSDRDLGCTRYHTFNDSSSTLLCLIIQALPRQLTAVLTDPTRCRCIALTSSQCIHASCRQHGHSAYASHSC